MDRQDIERRDFPVGRRGYDPAAVDEHLRRVADELEALRGRSAAPALAAGASEQVRVILEAAERSAQTLREQSERDAAEHVGHVQDAVATMLGRLAELEHALGAVFARVRDEGELLATGLAELRAQAAALGPAAAPADITAAEPEEDYAADAPGPAAAVEAADEAGARLTALNMALTGAPREETARFLAEHYTLADPEGLLDDVYARAAG